MIAIDLDENGLSDVWELRFGAVALVAEGDPDGDGFSNSVEAAVGTDPLKVSDFPRDLETLVHDPPVLGFSFFGHRDQFYTVLTSSSMDQFQPLSRPFRGRDGEVKIEVGSPGELRVSATVQHHLWSNIPSGSELSVLTNLESFPDQPDGKDELLEFARPSYYATGFGGAMMVSLVPKVSGIHRFSLSSSGPAELLIKTAGQAGDPFKIAEVLSGQSDLLPGVWDRYPGQTSLTFSLVAGEAYELEVRYIARKRRGHCEVAITQPSASEPVQVTAADFASRIIDLPAGQNTDRLFLKAVRHQVDQDGDGLSDWEERELAYDGPFLFFDSQTLPGVPDSTAFLRLVERDTALTEVALIVSDEAAYERNSPFPDPDHGAFLLTRTPSFKGLRVKLNVFSQVGNEVEFPAEEGEYELIDLSNGERISDEVIFTLFENSKTVQVVALPDISNEYPETLSLKLGESSQFNISNLKNSGTVRLFDFPDHPDNEALFLGRFTNQPGIESNGTGVASLVLNGSRREARISTTFTGLSSAQTGSQVWRSNQSSGVPLQTGTSIYPLTQIPGEEGGELVSGPLDDYPWDLSLSDNPQTVIDSLFGQSLQAPLYLDLQTMDHPSGESWAILSQSGGSQTDPGPPVLAAVPGSADFPQLSGEELESEVRRFLNQATFGATDDEVSSLVDVISTARIADPSYHRVTAFDEWLTAQMNLQQSYHVDFAFAADWQRYELAGTFDPVRNPPIGDLVAPSRPAIWPKVDRSNPDPEKWHLDLLYPISREDLSLLNTNNLSSEPDVRSERQVLWQMMINSRDQLRQKMGFALQQILVVSYSSSTLRQQSYAMANYQDLLNDGAFGSYRTLLGRVNYSPVMGKWLSSLQNQREADLDGDGSPDVFPDENLARENMQLFSIGLFEQWADGSVRLDSGGRPVPTYDNDD
ncbi:DUF1800 family protein, partial [Akkermansiaceae bacterium]|nr:DUF1800 family protein [Akkermansiaceae bacterium]